jgi:hypothetical protein
MVILHRRFIKGRILKSKEELTGSKQKENKCVVAGRYVGKAVSKLDMGCDGKVWHLVDGKT